MEVMGVREIILKISTFFILLGKQHCSVSSIVLRFVNQMKLVELIVPA